MIDLAKLSIQQDLTNTFTDPQLQQSHSTPNPLFLNQEKNQNLADSKNIEQFKKTAYFQHEKNEEQDTSANTPQDPSINSNQKLTNISNNSSNNSPEINNNVEPNKKQLNFKIEEQKQKEFIDQNTKENIQNFQQSIPPFQVLFKQNSQNIEEKKKIHTSSLQHENLSLIQNYNKINSNFQNQNNNNNSISKEKQLKQKSSPQKQTVHCSGKRKIQILHSPLFQIKQQSIKNQKLKQVDISGNSQNTADSFNQQNSIEELSNNQNKLTSAWSSPNPEIKNKLTQNQQQQQKQNITPDKSFISNQYQSNIEKKNQQNEEQNENNSQEIYDLGKNISFMIPNENQKEIEKFNFQMQKKKSSSSSHTHRKFKETGNQKQINQKFQNSCFSPFRIPRKFQLSKNLHQRNFNIKQRLDVSLNVK